jgi:nitronate monooxygenase
MLTTRFTELIGCSVPIQQAPIGGLANAELVAAVSNAGALGTKTVYGGTPDDTAQMIASVRKRTRAPFGANFVMNFMNPETVRECVAAAAGARLIEFFYSDPDPKLVDAAHAAGALAGWQVGSRDEAVAAADAGCDLVIAQGVEAGGHVRGKISLLALLNQVLGAVRVPIVAAGGIGSGRTMAAALAAGADAVRVGTRFVASVEAGAHPVYVDALIRAEAEDTLYSDTFNANWVGAPHRCLRASVEAALACTDEVVAELVDEETGEKAPIGRLDSTSPRRTMRGNIAAMPHWAGESVGGVKRVQPAAEIVHELLEECERRLREAAALAGARAGSGAGARAD